jgi:hypothetical protein
LSRDFRSTGAGDGDRSTGQIMSDAKLRDEAPETGAPPSGNERTVIKLPYAISNMVFIEALPFWILVILGVLGFFGGFVAISFGKSPTEVVPISIGSGVCAIVGWVGLSVLKRVLWRWALEGHEAAITLLFIFYVVGIILGPFFLLAIAAFVFLPMVWQLSMGGWLFVPFVFCGILWLFALTNVFEGDIWTFARLDGRCPRCRQWRFGRIREPQIIRCEQCGAELQFDRAE